MADRKKPSADAQVIAESLHEIASALNHMTEQCNDVGPAIIKLGKMLEQICTEKGEGE